MPSTSSNGTNILVRASEAHPQEGSWHRRKRGVCGNQLQAKQSRRRLSMAKKDRNEKDRNEKDRNETPTSGRRNLIAQPRLHQRAPELQAYGTVSHMLPLELEEPVRLEMTEQLNLLLADTMT